jgi:hypothetical protein
MKLVSILAWQVHAWREDCFRRADFYGDVTLEKALQAPSNYTIRSDEDKLKALSDASSYQVSAVLTCTKNSSFLS